MELKSCTNENNMENNTKKNSVLVFFLEKYIRKISTVHRQYCITENKIQNTFSSVKTTNLKAKFKKETQENMSKSYNIVKRHQVVKWIVHLRP